LGSIFLSLILFELLKLFLDPKKAFWLSILFLYFPARFFILRQIGAPETWFLATTLTSIFFFKKDKFWLSAIFAALSQAFKSPGVLLLVAYFIIAIHDLVKTKNLPAGRHGFGQVFKKYFPYLLVPLTIFGIFYLYQLQTGNFWAYFQSGDNFHLNPLPFLVFIGTQPWVNTIWLEDVIYIFVLSIYGVYRLLKKYKFDIVAIYSLVFLTATLFVAHRDISRYISPIYPLLLLSYQKILTKKSVKIILILMIPVILLYAINFVCGNTAPISDWTNYL